MKKTSTPMGKAMRFLLLAAALGALLAVSACSDAAAQPPSLEGPWQEVRLGLCRSLEEYQAGTYDTVVLRPEDSVGGSPLEELQVRLAVMMDCAVSTSQPMEFPRCIATFVDGSGEEYQVQVDENSLIAGSFWEGSGNRRVLTDCVAFASPPYEQLAALYERCR